MNFNRTRQAFLTLIALAALNVTAIGQEYNNVRALTEINTPDQAESYPYLSADGLRLYFLQGTGGYGTLRVATRTDVNDVFGNIQTVLGLPADISSYSLSSDEREIMFYLKNNTNLYWWRKTSVNNASPHFNIPSEIDKRTLSFNNGGIVFNTLYAPSFRLTNCGNKILRELYISHLDNGRKSVIRYFQNQEGSAQFGNATILMKEIDGYEPESGQLSKDGTKYYISLRNFNTNNRKLYSISVNAIGIRRTNCTAPLNETTITNSNLITKYTSLSGEITSNNPIQPSLSTFDINTTANGETQNQFVVFTQNFGGYWEGDDLYIARHYIGDGGRLGQKELSIATNKLALHAPIPNPSSGEVLFRYSLPAETQEATLAIYSVEGIKLKEVELNTELGEFYQKNHDLSDGYYYCVLTTPQGRSVQRLVIIK